MASTTAQLPDLSFTAGVSALDLCAVTLHLQFAMALLGVQQDAKP
jgi:hypothetical protein